MSNGLTLGTRVKLNQLDRAESTERAVASWGVLDPDVVFSGGCQGSPIIYPLFLASQFDPDMSFLANGSPCLQ